MPYDKALHHIVGLYITLMPLNWYWLLLIGIVVALCRELYNKFTDGKFDWLDAAYTVAGTLVGLLIKLM